MCEKYDWQISDIYQKYQALESLATESIFKLDGSKILNNNKEELFHATVARDFYYALE